MSHHLSPYVRPSLAAGALALALTLLIPTDGAAQDRRVVISGLPIAHQMRIQAEMVESGKEADRLLVDAENADRAGSYEKAAQLYERSGHLRTPGDNQGSAGFEEAGRAFFSAGRPAQASRAWGEAGNRALILGDVYGASLNYMRAALGAQEAGQGVRAVDFAWKAYYLSESPLLSSDQKKELRRFIEVTTS